MSIPLNQLVIWTNCLKFCIEKLNQSINKRSTDDGNIFQLTIFKKIHILSGFEDFRVTAWDLHSSMESNEVRWTTQTFRIPSPNCHGANFLSRMKNIGCKYDNLTFGAGQDSLKSFSNVTTLKKCFELCVKESCSTYALDMGTKSLYISPVVSHWYGTEYEILAGFERIGGTENYRLGHKVCYF